MKSHTVGTMMKDGMPNITDKAAHQELDTLATYVTINDKRIASLFRWSSWHGTSLDFLFVFFFIFCAYWYWFSPPPYLVIFLFSWPWIVHYDICLCHLQGLFTKKSLKSS